QRQDGDLRGAAATLDQCPPAQRGWEHGYLRRLTRNATRPLGVEAAAGSVLAFSPDGAHAARADGADLALFAAATGQRLHAPPGHAGKVTWLAFHEGGKEVAAVGEDNVLRRWAVATGKEVGAQKLPFSVSRGAALSPDGKRIATWGRGGLVRMFGDPN